jgi:WD40 repeat protein
MGKRRRLRTGVAAALSVTAGGALSPLTSDVKLPVVGASVLAGLGIAGYAAWEAWQESTAGADRLALGWNPPGADGSIDRPELAARLAAALMEPGQQQVALTTVRLQGAGGFGKTTLAAQICRRADIRARFPGGLAWITVGAGSQGQGAALADKFNSLARLPVEPPPTFNDPDLAGRDLIRRLARFPPSLLVIDDVWTAEQLVSLDWGGAPQCRRLVTTRRPDLLRTAVDAIDVDEMTPAEATELLHRGLEQELPGPLLARLLELSGRMPLMLALINGTLAVHARSGLPLPSAAGRVIQALESSGPAVLDSAIDRQRTLAVSACIEYGLDYLEFGSRGDSLRFRELGIFSAGATPVAALRLLWGLDPAAVDRLCARLADLSLVRLVRTEDGDAVWMHDVVHYYAWRTLGPERRLRAHQRLVAAARALAASGSAGPTPWWELPDAQAYLRRRLVYHLSAADLRPELEWLVTDLRWLTETVARFGPVAAEADLGYAETDRASELSRAIAQSAHLLAPDIGPDSLAQILLARLSHVPALRDELAAVAQRLRGPRLEPLWPLPDAPDRHLRRVLRKAGGSAWGCLADPDGRWIASLGWDGVVRVWDVDSHEISQVIHAHDEQRPGQERSWILGGSVSPDGQRIATACVDGRVRVWDIAGGSRVCDMAAYNGMAHACAFSPDGRLLGTVGYDFDRRHPERETERGAVRLWDAASGRSLAELGADLPDLRSCAFSPDGSLLAVGGTDGGVRLWSLPGGQPWPVLTGHTKDVVGCAFSPDGSTLATASADGTARLWDLSSGRCQRTLAAHEGGLTASAFSPDGALLATAGEDGTARLWDRASGDCLRVLSGGDKQWVVGCEFAADGTWIATAEQDGTIRLWDYAAQADQDQRAQTSVHSCAIAPNGSWIATAGPGADLHLWDGRTGGLLRALPASGERVAHCAIFPDGNGIVSVGWASSARAGIVRVWRPSATFAWEAHNGEIRGCAISPDGTWIATAGRWQTGSAVSLWDVGTGASLGGPMVDERAFLRLVGDDCVIYPDGRRLAGVGSTEALVWDVATGKIVLRLTGHTGDVVHCAISPDGRWLVTGSRDKTARIWDADSGQCLHVLRHEGIPHGAFSADGRWLATVAREELRVWNCLSGRCLAVMRVNGQLSDCCWFPDRSTLCAAGDHGLYGFVFRQY